MGDACAECDRHTITLLNTQNIADVAPTRQILQSIMHIKYNKLIEKQLDKPRRTQEHHLTLQQHPTITEIEIVELTKIFKQHHYQIERNVN